MATDGTSVRVHSLPCWKKACAVTSIGGTSGYDRGTHFFVVAGGQQEPIRTCPGRLPRALATLPRALTTLPIATGYAPVTHRASDTALVAGRGDVLARDTDFRTAEGWREI